MIVLGKYLDNCLELLLLVLIMIYWFLSFEVVRKWDMCVKIFIRIFFLVIVKKEKVFFWFLFLVFLSGVINILDCLKDLLRK